MSWAHTQKAITANWPEAKIERLKNLWKAGLSASQIASDMGHGTTRNAVLGKVHRLKLPKRRTIVHRPRSNVWSVEALARSKRRSEARRARKLATANKRLTARIAKPAPMPELEIDLTALTLPAWEALEGTTPISLLAATDATCRWPIGDPIQPGFGFCGCATVAGSSYCAIHKARGTQKAPAKSKNIHRVIPAFNTTHSFGLKVASREEIEAL